MVMETPRSPFTPPAARTLAVLLAVLTAVFCLVTFTPQADADPGCQGHKLCAQSDSSVPVAVIVEATPLHQGTVAPPAWLPVPSSPHRVFQLAAVPAAPRAPPQSLA